MSPRVCRKCRRDFSGESLNYKTTCFRCQHAAATERGKRLYQKRKARAAELAAPRVDVLCGCGWGLLGISELDVPSHCPLCGHDIGGAR